MFRKKEGIVDQYMERQGMSPPKKKGLFKKKTREEEFQSYQAEIARLRSEKDYYDKRAEYRSTKKRLQKSIRKHKYGNIKPKAKEELSKKELKQRKKRKETAGRVFNKIAGGLADWSASVSEPPPMKKKDKKERFDYW